ncbi:hypothetical protein M438DRAFT_338162 [Aureobasidium pullulans EXF-150]|uniref:Uncharacterized protein n=1 Tax=Aureobasidium pullulans EXF-150 TaxID=1043002 RepID=A0A074X7M0_AURPU|nr:uncharacterized protein M438DRAFT_338162 [Aureobasidium pullulans EXF-150]KEQ81388.1 hypothetical protein M438DRAFT_338162 [Aureobasidium pullulans EXF-150]
MPLPKALSSLMARLPSLNHQGVKDDATVEITTATLLARTLLERSTHLLKPRLVPPTYIKLHLDHRVVVDATAFHKIAPIETLKELTITLPDAIAKISPTAFMALGNVVNLRTLKIIPLGKISCDVSVVNLVMLERQWKGMDCQIVRLLDTVRFATVKRACQKEDQGEIVKIEPKEVKGEGVKSPNRMGLRKKLVKHLQQSLRRRLFAAHTSEPPSHCCLHGRDS